MEGAFCIHGGKEHNEEEEEDESGKGDVEKKHSI